MSVVLDTSGWLAFFADEPHAEAFAPYVHGPVDEVLVPPIVDYEVYRWALRTLGEEGAATCAGFLAQRRAVVLDAEIARLAAELAHRHQLAACDALILATAEIHDAEVVTSDEDLRHLPRVVFHPKPSRTGNSPKARRAERRRT